MAEGLLPLAGEAIMKMAELDAHTLAAGSELLAAGWTGSAAATLDAAGYVMDHVAGGATGAGLHADAHTMADVSAHHAADAAYWAEHAYHDIVGPPAPEPPPKEPPPE